MRNTSKKQEEKRSNSIAKSQRGITLVALVITIIIIIILATVTINIAFNGGIIDKAELASDMYANDTAYTDQAMANATAYLDEMLNGVTGGTEEPETPLTDGSFSEEEGVNTPKLASNMKLVVYDEDNNTWKEDTTKSAYSYKNTATEGANSSEWANAEVTEDGITSYFVWIPRYAYKIIGENNIDIKFIKGTGKETVDGTPCKYVSENPTTDDYIVHPAFTDEEENGGWDSQIAGIWIGKYETSSVEGNSNSAEDNVTTKTAQVRAGVSSWRNIQIGNMYTVAKAYAPSLESHMLKNSEWGAVAYLTESKYGRNGTEVEINNNGTTYYTGGGTEADAIETNQLQSSTGNVYGIYDLSGNAHEYVASYYKDGNFSYANSTFTTGTSDKYSTTYDGTDVNTNYKYGDATYETSSWHSDYAKFVNSNYPFFNRGGHYYSGDSAGVFCFNGSNGYSNSSLSFRLALVL